MKNKSSPSRMGGALFSSTHPRHNSKTSVDHVFTRYNYPKGGNVKPPNLDFGQKFSVECRR
jgi:hypothetical protein